MIKELLLNLKSGQSRTAKASRQVIYSFVSQAVSIIVSLLYVPLLLNYLTQEKYGIWLTLTSIIGWFSFFDIGLGNGMRNKLTESNTVGNYDLGKKYVSTTYALLICIFSAILVIFHIINPFINWNAVLNSTSISFHDLYLLTSIVFTFFILRFIVQLIGVIYIADHQPSIENGINAISSIFSLAIVFILTKLTYHGDLVMLGSIITIMPVLLFVLLSIYSFKNNYKFLRPSIKSIDFKLSSGLMNLGVKFFLLQVTSVILYSTSSVFISQFYGPKEVVVYNLVFKYYQLPIMVFTIVLSPLWSAVTSAFVTEDYAWLKTTMKRLNILSFVFMAGIIAMTFLANYVFRLWVGDKITVPLNLTILMAVYAMMNVFLAPYSYFINGTGKLKLTMIFSFVGIALYFVCIFAFGKKFDNSSGVLVAILIPYIIFTFLQPFQAYRILSRKAKGIYLE